MPSPPLTHHDIIRLASPLRARGLIIQMDRTDKSDRYIEFGAQSSLSPNIHCIHTLRAGTDNKHQLTRVLIHRSGLVSTLEASSTDLDKTLDTFELVPQEQQMREQEDHIIANSYSLKSIDGRGIDPPRAQLQFSCSYIAGLELRVDISTGGSMPADVRVIINGRHTSYLPETLASGEDLPLIHRAARPLSTTLSPAMETKTKPTGNASINSAASNDVTVTSLPEDLLAVLGPQWRPMRYQGDHWKGVLRTLGSEPSRTARAERFITRAVAHIGQSLQAPPAAYHERLQSARRRVYWRRLQPVMFFVAILAMMPLSWLLVSTGEMALHPLALSLTPLLMVGVVVMTAKEIPIMEIPDKPAPIPDHFWTSEVNKT